MPFTVEDFPDLLRLLDQHPEWQAELRRRLLTDELLELPALVRQLAERMDALTQRMDALTQRMDALAEAQIRTEHRLDALTQRMDALAQRMERVEAQIERLVEVTGRLDSKTGWLVGHVLEQEYRVKAPAYFGTIVRRAHVLSHEDLDQLLDQAMDSGALTLDEKRDTLLLDLVVQGTDAASGGSTYLAVEVSARVDADDVERADRRAASLAKAVGRTLPVVAGQGVLEEGTQRIRELHVWQLLDGRVLPPVD